MITDKTKALVATLYREGLTIAEICKRTVIRSSATIYNIVTELGIKGEKGKKRGTFSVVLTLPVELREWVEEQGEGLSELVTKVGYTEIEGRSKKRNLGAEIVYTRFEGTSGKTEYTESEGTNQKSSIRISRVQNDGIKISRVAEDEMPFSQIEGKERISDIITKTDYTESEGTSENEPPVAKLDLAFLRGGKSIKDVSILSYVEEKIVSEIAAAIWVKYANDTLGADEVAVCHDGELLWLWQIEDLSYTRSEGGSK